MNIKLFEAILIQFMEVVDCIVDFKRIRVYGSHNVLLPMSKSYFKLENL